MENFDFSVPIHNIEKKGRAFAEDPSKFGRVKSKWQRILKINMQERAVLHKPKVSSFI